ncbi:hypothetical protein [Parashewanella tropica]|uniref:hypothetical protein n=1 Tax=Parashewanella tropica TaxID=2547970 RepID=UPI001059B985|nr:hypothetical protein [Parashewanella tropica]
MFSFPALNPIFKAMGYLRETVTIKTAAHREDCYEMSPITSPSVTIGEFHSSLSSRTNSQNSCSDNPETKVPAYTVLSTSFTPQTKTITESAASVKAEQSVMHTAIRLMGEPNPALWHPKDFTTKIVLRHDDDLFQKFGDLCVQKLQAGCPLPMIGIEHTTTDMLQEVDEYLQVDPLQVDDRIGLESFRSLLCELRKRNFPYSASTKLCLMFPLIQQLFFSRYAHTKQNWDDSHRMLAADKKINTSLSIMALLQIPTLDTLVEPERTSIARCNIISSITCVPVTNELDNFGILAIQNDLIKNQYYKIYFYSFSEFSIPEITHFSFTSMVPVSLVKTPSSFIHSSHFPCSYPPYHDNLHELAVQSHIPAPDSFSVMRQYYLCVEPKLSPELSVVNQLLLLYWFHDAQQGEKLSIYRIPDFETPDDYFISLDELFDSVLETWDDIPQQKQLMMTDSLIKGIIFFAFVFQFNHMNLESIADINSHINSMLFKIRKEFQKPGINKSLEDQSSCMVFNNQTDQGKGLNVHQDVLRLRFLTHVYQTAEKACTTPWEKLSIQEKLKLTYFYLEHVEH